MCNSAPCTPRSERTIQGRRRLLETGEERTELDFQVPSMQWGLCHRTTEVFCCAPRRRLGLCEHLEGTQRLNAERAHAVSQPPGTPTPPAGRSTLWVWVCLVQIILFNIDVLMIYPNMKPFLMRRSKSLASLRLPWLQIKSRYLRGRILDVVGVVLVEPG